MRGQQLATLAEGDGELLPGLDCLHFGDSCRTLISTGKHRVPYENVPRGRIRSLFPYGFDSRC
jgi:hypothetical protein